MSILLYFLYILPYRLGFNVTPEAGSAVLDMVVDLLLLVDIVLNFKFYYRAGNTGLVVYDGQTIRSNCAWLASLWLTSLCDAPPSSAHSRAQAAVSRWRAADLKSWFIIDFCTVVP